MSKMWEVDPETKSKLLDIQKENDNMKCVDCGAPSPQWVCLESCAIYLIYLHTTSSILYLSSLPFL